MADAGGVHDAGRCTISTNFHHAALDAHPDDSAARLLLAEHLAERGDPDAAGYRWMAKRRKRPFDDEWGCWGWFLDDDSIQSAIGAEMSKWFEGKSTVVFATRREAEAALCRVVEKLQGTELTNDGVVYADVIS